MPDEKPPSEKPIIDPELLEMLRCPLSRKPLVLRDGMLYCYESRKKYRIEDGIPVMLVEEALDIPESEIPEKYREKENHESP